MNIVAIGRYGITEYAILNAYFLKDRVKFEDKTVFTLIGLEETDSTSNDKKFLKVDGLASILSNKGIKNLYIKNKRINIKDVLQYDIERYIVTGIDDAGKIILDDKKNKSEIRVDIEKRKVYLDDSEEHSESEESKVEKDKEPSESEESQIEKEEIKESSESDSYVAEGTLKEKEEELSESKGSKTEKEEKPSESEDGQIEKEETKESSKCGADGTESAPKEKDEKPSESEESKIGKEEKPNENKEGQIGEEGKTEKKERKSRTGRSTCEEYVASIDKEVSSLMDRNTYKIMLDTLSDVYIDESLGVKESFARYNDNEREGMFRENISREIARESELKVEASDTCDKCHGKGYIIDEFGLKVVCSCVDELRKSIKDDKKIIESFKPIATSFDKDAAVANGYIPLHRKSDSYRSDFVRKRMIWFQKSLDCWTSKVEYDTYIETLESIMARITRGEAPTLSYAISSPNGMGKNTFANTCIMVMFGQGKKCAPYLSLKEIAEYRLKYSNQLKNQDSPLWLTSNKFSWADFVNAEVLFTYMIGGDSANIELDTLNELIKLRSSKNKPTILFSDRSFTEYKYRSLGLFADSIESSSIGTMLCCNLVMRPRNGGRNENR